MLVATLAITASSCTPKRAHPANVEVLRDRAEFYRAIQKVKEGMSPAKVEKILGKPDDVTRPSDPREQVDTNVNWGYGTDEHLGLPTLGYVVFKEGKVLWSPWLGEKPFHQLMPEAELRSTLRRLWRVAPGSLGIVQAVNVLEPLGKDRALFALEQFCNIGADAQPRRVELKEVIQALFDDPDHPLPTLTASEAKGGTRIPDSSIVMLNDIPFTVFRQRMGGHPEPPSFAIDYYRKSGKAARATPTTSGRSFPNRAGTEEFDGVAFGRAAIWSPARRRN